MSELKAITAYEANLKVTSYGDNNVLVYLKSAADKVISDLEMKIAMAQQALRLNKPEALFSNLYTMGRLKHEIYVVERRERHHKYKRLFFMAQEWRNYAAFCGMQSSCHNHRGFGKTAEKWTWKEIHAWKCVNRLMKISEKFKEAK